jgi:UDP-GlcNAc:undecaprenyl-phosphate GlcNAc-1-phosphate transferase
LNHFEISSFPLLLIQSFFITIAAVLLLRPIAFKICLVDKPCSRKRHEGEIPLIGGLAIYLAITYIFLTQTIDVPGNTAFFTAVTVIVVTGLIDDFKNLNFKTRFAAEVVAAMIMIMWGGVQITSLGDLFGFGEIELGIFSTLFTVFAIVGGINAFNMMDGIDGLAAGNSFVVYFFLSILSIFFNDAHLSLFCFILAPATAAFLLFNAPIPGRKNTWAFLGDTGSMLLGFTICWLVISASQGEHKIISPVTVLWLIAVPLLDTCSIIIRRIRKGRSPFAPDREHLHHILPVAGYGRQTTLLVILAFGVILGLLGIIGSVFFNAPDWLMFYLFLTIFALYYWGMSHSWKMVKIARYLREHNNDRRKNKNRRISDVGPLTGIDRRSLTERRSGLDRRYHATHGDLRIYRKLSLSLGLKSYKPTDPQITLKGNSNTTRQVSSGPQKQ